MAANDDDNHDNDKDGRKSTAYFDEIILNFFNCNESTGGQNGNL